MCSIARSKSVDELNSCVSDMARSCSWFPFNKRFCHRFNRLLILLQHARFKGVAGTNKVFPLKANKIVTTSLDCHTIHGDVDRILEARNTENFVILVCDLRQLRLTDSRPRDSRPSHLETIAGIL